ncbi:MAG TPA: ribonuclease Z [Marinilabiliales bacterium]|jgi:ribonuclease Z|nr:MAG: ribonuclease Z [Bacteroidetes bacterium GWA2_40_14]OFX62729.1 MAG: ribonuclease Z [Bacteroidetes bacterium GWC2_40_13]OFX72002.1 MAG: ribonuclease Z [Bacteroidetes bacterium GWD2_40_43]OFX89607.1 MAG: ribonuclease Z [Bacteroidetes bacterium GWE2_40_63]OFY24126.1 MAG: ribonuclease Z [Bacteroidetes bacterium GWF2_40_13]OFZ26318.1 MAG: ribonuclease Z [Bacteroidetes bacterium RIFOXYC2_FULL_40_12]HAM99539.1 ribonuclease Z [Marinilabiliales bacterium]
MVFSLTILGSSSALPAPNRFSTAQVLNVLERFFLIDCGEGTQIQLRRFKIKYTRINHVFISHLHGDHFLGIFGFISSLNLINRKEPLHIYGPFLLKELIDQFVSTMDHGMGYEIVFHPLHYNGEEIIYEDDKLTVESFPLRHRIPTCGFLFKEKPRLRRLDGARMKELQIPIKWLQAIKEGADFISEEGVCHTNESLTFDAIPPRSYAFVSDTAKLPAIIPIINGVDLLYHEATFSDEGKKRAKQTGHTTASQAAEIAKLANVQKLIIGHFSHRYKSLDGMLDEARAVFPNTFLCEDGMVFNVE